MTEQVQQEPTALDTAKLVGAVAVVAGGVAAFYLLAAQPIWLRWLIVLASLAMAGLIGLQSYQGRAFRQFVQSARIELRKVVWPSRQETMQVTLVVFAMVIAMGLFFWGLDWILASLTRWLTGR
ncbi:MAG: preprotein translocase subunit SecE [Proteobacteria bacterium]|nr:MAG: preprotein translocase subunit SecE [Pseudomonadota bacterium]